MSTVRQNEKRQIRVPNKLEDSDYGTVIAKNRRNKNKKDAKANDGIDVVFVSQNDDFVEMMNENQTGVILEEDKVQKGLNDVEKGIGKVDMIDIVNKGMPAERIQNDEVQKENDESNKFSYAKMVNNSNLNNKLSLIPTGVNDNGIEVVIFYEEIVNEGSKKWKLTVCGYFVGYKMSYQEMRHNDKNGGCKPKTVDEFIKEEKNEFKQNQINDEFIQVQHRKKGGRKMNVTKNCKKETIWNKSKNVVYRPVEKSNLVVAEGTKHGTEEDQMNGMNSPKENIEQKSDVSNAKKINKTGSQKKDRNMNSFEILSEYDDMKELEFEMLETMLCIIKDICSQLVSFVSFVYAANGSIERRILWADPSMHKQISTGKPWMIGGDMNVILNINEHSAGASFISRDETRILKKLDTVMVNEDFMKKYSQAHVLFNPYLVSDHSQAVIIFPNSMKKKKKKAFKFANFVTDKDDFKTIIEKEWRTKVGGFQMFQLVKKLRNLKVHLKNLAWQNGNLFEKVEKIRDNLKNMQRDLTKILIIKL
nr:hypothetical protein [Tanacetum cinerariifolium]